MGRRKQWTGDPAVMEGIKRALMNKVAGQETARINSGGGSQGGQPQTTGPGAEDDLGIGVQARGMQVRQDHIQAERERDPYGTAISGYGTIGPLPDRGWQGFFQALQERGVSKVAGGPSAAGSNQIRGQSVQPDYFTTGETFGGRTNQNYKGTMFAPGQQDAYGRTFEQQEAHKTRLRGLKVAATGQR